MPPGHLFPSCQDSQVSKLPVAFGSDPYWRRPDTSLIIDDARTPSFRISHLEYFSNAVDNELHSILRHLMVDLLSADRSLFLIFAHDRTLHLY